MSVLVAGSAAHSASLLIEVGYLGLVVVGCMQILDHILIWKFGYFFGRVESFVWDWAEVGLLLILRFFGDYSGAWCRSLLCSQNPWLYAGNEPWEVEYFF